MIKTCPQGKILNQKTDVLKINQLKSTYVKLVH